MKEQLIIYEGDDGVLAIIRPWITENGPSAKEIANKDAPKDRPHMIINTDQIKGLPAFRDAWKIEGNFVVTDLMKAKIIAHENRRRDRDEAFEPLDRQATIPSESEAAEAARVIIRNKDAAYQIEIDNAADELALLEVCKGITF